MKRFALVLLCTMLVGCARHDKPKNIYYAGEAKPIPPKANEKDFTKTQCWNEKDEIIPCTSPKIAVIKMGITGECFDNEYNSIECPYAQGGKYMGAVSQKGTGR